MTVTELLAMASDYLGIAIDDGGRFTTTVAMRYLNLGYADLLKRAECKSRTATIAAVDAQDVYDLPADMVIPLQVWYDAATTPLEAKDETLLDKQEPGWRAYTAGTPTAWAIAGAGQIRLIPAPSVSGSVDITVRGVITPLTSEDNGTIPPLVNEDPYDGPMLPERFAHAPALWAAYKMSEILFSDDPKAVAGGELALKEYGELEKELRADGVTRNAY